MLVRYNEAFKFPAHYWHYCRPAVTHAFKHVFGSCFLQEMDGFKMERKLFALLTVSIVAFSMLSAIGISVFAKPQQPPESSELKFEAHLTGRTWTSRVNSSVTYTIDTKAQGQVMFRVSEDGSKIEFMLLVANIQNITMAHIHIDTGVTLGPIVVWLYPRQPPLNLIPGRFDGVLSKGTITAADLTGPLAGKSMSDLVEMMQKGETYVVVHTSQNPPGEIRGFTS